MEKSQTIQEIPTITSCRGVGHYIAGHVSAEVIEKYIQQMKMKRNSSTG